MRSSAIFSIFVPGAISASKRWSSDSSVAYGDSAADAFKKIPPNSKAASVASLFMPTPT
jgi:hypothetical protein